MRGVLLLTLCALLMLVVWGHIDADKFWVAVLTDSAHGPVFAAITFILLYLRCGLVRSPAISWRVVGQTVLLAVILGAMTEVLQGFVGRDAQIQDLFHDALGAVAGAGFFIYFGRPVQEKPAIGLRRASLGCAILASVVLVSPVATVAAAYWLRDDRFPVLFDSNLILGSYFLRAYNGVVAERASLPAFLQSEEERRGLHVMGGQESWALGLWETHADWRGKHALYLRLANPTDQAIEMRMRVFDQHHRRDRKYGFNRGFTIAPRSTATLSVPLSDLAGAAGKQRVDLSAMAGVISYGPVLDDDRGFYLVRMWLE